MNYKIPLDGVFEIMLFVVVVQVQQPSLKVTNFVRFGQGSDIWNHSLHSIWN